MKLGAFFKNSVLIILSITIGLVLAEYVYRAILFGGSTQFKNLRKPGLYADHFSEDDYWKLYNIFETGYAAPAQPHKTLGWVGNFDRISYLHHDSDKLKDKRPVLLYGDSFAQCVESTCFEEILNGDSIFTKNHFFINYGVGGYGADQIYLLLQRSLDHFKNPFVIISIMPLDLDRSHLSVRVGQKPYFTISHDELELSKDSIYSNAHEYFKENPPEITSYLYRRLIYSNIIPERIRSRLRGKWKAIQHKKELNTKIILNMKHELEARNCEYVFLIFHPLQKSDLKSHGWRDDFLLQLFQENNIPYIWSKDLIRNDSSFSIYDRANYINLDNGHPNTHFNRIVSSEFKRLILNKESKK
ncbi:hypothetical protein QQ008_01635 [Fulvivirgaceae bacterium BMA10]|uniref:SGNH/GDSL hydrolase family protein n=1 Tax=Splendidivirga corallicola TaxID=3051826 RepID=A0ABT8KH44_9BACT|nr:hypothetical protein [Fulvivirgaceae bacterium BMA10]